MFSKTFLLLDILFMLILIICSITDIKKRIVPNTCIVLLLVIGIVKVILDSIAGYPWCMHISGLIYTVPFFIAWSKNQMGAGDVKMIMAICLYLGLLKLIIVFIGMATALLGYVLIALIRGKNFACSIPLVPYMTLGHISYIIIKCCS